MLKEGSRPADLDAMDLLGKPRRLHDFRRKAHVVLLWDPSADLDAWRERRKREAQRWTWLQAEPIVPASAPADLVPGTYLISRWGHVIAIHPPGPWDLDRIERDLLTFESQDCCDLSKAP